MNVKITAILLSFRRAYSRGEGKTSPGPVLFIMHDLNVYHFDKSPLTFFSKCCTGRAVLNGCPPLHPILFDRTGFNKDLLHNNLTNNQPQPVGFRFTGWALFLDRFLLILPGSLLKNKLFGQGGWKGLCQAPHGGWAPPTFWLDAESRKFL